jgi:hypothetical protein
MGVSIRTRKPIALSLAPFVWKLLIGCNVTWSDLEDVDLNYARSVRAATCDAAALPGDRLEGVSFSGKTVPLVDGGERIHINNDNRCIQHNSLWPFSVFNETFSGNSLPLRPCDSAHRNWLRPWQRFARECPRWPPSPSWP